MASGRSAKTKDEESAFNLPFEELDPCCQKEIINADHHARVGAQLRKHDRSKLREDERMKAFNSLRQGFGCVCGSNDCLIDGDYPLLAMLRQTKADDDIFVTSNEKMATKVDSEGDDSDDDSLLFGLGEEYLTPEERERLFEWNERQRTLDIAARMGYASHTDDKPAHLRTLLDNKQSLVLHICDTKSILCAALDLTLEKVASQFLGTKFRRLQMSSESTYFVETELERQRQVHGANQISNHRRSVEGPCLLCFKNGVICAYECHLEQFGSNDMILEADLIKYLENTHVLCAEAVELSLENLKAIQDSEREDTDAAGEENSYCGFMGCNRTYAHSHVQAGADSLIKSDKEEGIEALAGNIFTRI